MGFASSAGGELINRYGNKLPYVGKIAANAALGGCVSVLGGGKFANGAMTAAYTMMFNDLMHDGGDGDNEKSSSIVTSELKERGGVYYLNGHIIGEKPMESIWPEFDALVRLRCLANFIGIASSSVIQTGRKAVTSWLKKVDSMKPDKLRNDLIKVGFKRQSIYSEHYKRGDIIIRLDGPHKNTKYNHMHIEYKKQSYDINLNKVNRRSPDAHIRIR